MKRYFVKITAFVLALMLPFAVMLTLLAGTPDKPKDSLVYSMHYKLDLLKETDSPRILIAGGSASEYGVICEEIANSTGRTTICLGVTVYIGLDIYLGMLDKYSVSGDTVILMMENGLLRYNMVNYDLLWSAIGTDPDVWAVVPLKLWPNLIRTSWRYYRDRVAENGSVFTNGWRPAVYDGYIGRDFGPWGDITLDRPQTLLASGYNTQDLIELNAWAPDPDSLERIAAFAKKMEERGVKVLFAHAPLDRLCVTSSDRYNRGYARAVEQGVNIPVIMPLENAIMPAEYFYDSNNHLTTPGAEIYTRTLIENLLPHIS